MYFAQGICAFLAIRSVVVLASVPKVTHDPRVRGSYLSTATAVTGGKVERAKDVNYSPAQIPILSCPEWFSSSPIDYKYCGGEDPVHKGSCSKPVQPGGS